MMRSDIFVAINWELLRAAEKYETRFRSLNEALGTIRAEYRELEDTIVQHQGRDRIQEEALQVAAMAIKLIEYLGGEEDALQDTVPTPD